MIQLDPSVRRDFETTTFPPMEEEEDWIYDACTEVYELPKVDEKSWAPYRGDGMRLSDHLTERGKENRWDGTRRDRNVTYHLFRELGQGRVTLARLGR